MRENHGETAGIFPQADTDGGGTGGSSRGDASGLPQITLDGDLQLLIERHRGITEYGTQRIRIATKSFTVELTGKDMHLVAMDRENIRIRGRITGVQYLYQEQELC